MDSLDNLDDYGNNEYVRVYLETVERSSKLQSDLDECDLPGVEPPVISDDLDINDAFDNLLFLEENLAIEGFHAGYQKGVAEGNVEGYHLGYHRGAELGAELGYYSGIVDSYLELLKDKKGAKIDKIFKNLVILQSLIVTFPRENSEDVDIIDLMDNIRCLYKKVCSLLKISPNYPEADKLNF